VVVGLLNANQLELVNVLALSGKPLVVVSMGLPYLAARVPLAQGVLAVYSYRETAAEAAAAALFGEAPTPGRLPVSLPRLPFGFGLRLQPGSAGTTAQPGAR
jgi:beta-N-acetylhexosaminidase